VGAPPSRVARSGGPDQERQHGPNPPGTPEPGRTSPPPGLLSVSPSRWATPAGPATHGMLAITINSSIAALQGQTQSGKQRSHDTFFGKTSPPMGAARRKPMTSRSARRTWSLSRQPRQMESRGRAQLPGYACQLLGNRASDGRRQWPLAPLVEVGCFARAGSAARAGQGSSGSPPSVLGNSQGNDAASHYDVSRGRNETLIRLEPGREAKGIGVVKRRLNEQA